MINQIDQISIYGRLLNLNNSADSMDSCIKAEGVVRSPWMLKDISLIGFIPYNFTKMEVFLNRPFTFTPFMLKLDNSNFTSLIYKTVRCAKGRKYSLNANLLIIPILDDIPPFCLQSQPDSYQFIYGTEILRILTKYKAKDLKGLNNLVEENDDKTYSYIGRDFEWELVRGGITFICRDFLCLCSYMNQVSGKLDYVLLPSDDIIQVIPDEVK